MKTSTLVWGVVVAIAVWWLWTVIAKQQRVATSSAAARPPATPAPTAVPSAVDYSGAFANTMDFHAPA